MVDDIIVNLRPATIEDLNAVYEMAHGFTGSDLSSLGLSFNSEKLNANLKLMIEKKAALVLTHSFDGIIGLVAGLVENSGVSQDIFFNAFIFYVKPKYRQYTVKFIRLLEQYLKKTPATHFVISNPSYAPMSMNRFFKMMGFKELERDYIKAIERNPCPAQT